VTLRGLACPLLAKLSAAGVVLLFMGGTAKFPSFIPVSGVTPNFWFVIRVSTKVVVTYTSA